MNASFNLKNPPLFLVLHGNNPTVWKKQNVKRRWELPRIPFFRIRPATSVAGHEETVQIPSEADFSYGTEFGVVIGRDAKHVPEQEALEYVAGYSCINDMYCNCYRSWFGETLLPYEDHSLVTLGKAVDGCGGIGPTLTSKNIVPDPCNLLTYTRENRCFKDRAYTGSYLFRIEYLIAYLSRFMTLPVGTVISLGAAGWDGIRADLPKYSSETISLEMEVESIGCLKNNLTRSAVESDYTSSPFLMLQNRRRTANLQAGPSNGNSLWMLHGNYETCEAVEGIPRAHFMRPHLFPSLSLTCDSSPLIIPPHATNLTLTCQLAGIIGKPAYHVSKERAWDFFSGLALIVAIHDSSLIDPVIRSNCYEQRAAYFLGSCGDGFNRISAPIPVHQILSRLDNLAMTVQLGGKSVTTRPRDYLHSLADMLSIISHGVTLLPGDVLSLGPAGVGLVISETAKAKGRIKADLGDALQMELPVEDLRNPDQKDKEVR